MNLLITSKNSMKLIINVTTFISFLLFVTHKNKKESLKYDNGIKVDTKSFIDRVIYWFVFSIEHYLLDIE